MNFIIFELCVSEKKYQNQYTLHYLLNHGVTFLFLGTIRDDKNIHIRGYLRIKSVMDTERIA
jgi:hypothetical protein